MLSGEDGILEAKKISSRSLGSMLTEPDNTSIMLAFLVRRSLSHSDVYQRACNIIFHRSLVVCGASKGIPEDDEGSALLHPCVSCSNAGPYRLNEFALMFRVD